MKLLVTGLLFFSSLAVCTQASSATPNWSEKAPPQGANPYQLPETLFASYRDAGKIHAQIYPVEITGILPPYEPIRHLIDDRSKNPLREFLNTLFRSTTGYKNMEDLLKDLGLHDYPKADDRGVYGVPYPNGIRPEHPMGMGLIDTAQGLGFTFSCAACHSSNLFGKTVLGMTNRFPRANGFFIKAKKASEMIQPQVFKLYTEATNGETDMIKTFKKNMRAVGLKQPQALGLDTSLAQVSLSLNRRNPDAYASFNDHYASFPRPDRFLDHQPADSKPAVWWNVKYKNRWLSDGSVVSGNPIFTNILWNEIGRGTDLAQLEKWLSENNQVIQEITTAVFSSEAPRFTDFFPASKIDVSLAKQGEQIFNKTCARCHGHYDKAWSLPEANQLSPEELLRTTQVRYKKQTPVEDVGTDTYRSRGMKSLEQLNRLAISQKNGILIRAEEGYVPPPLVGIWARWPYFHNNSVPSLCALLTAGKDRPRIYYSGEALDPETDFDSQCNGYPVGAATPRSWKTSERLYDTRKAGMSNLGHDEDIFLENGRELLLPEQKRALIQFLQTL